MSESTFIVALVVILSLAITLVKIMDWICHPVCRRCGEKGIETLMCSIYPTKVWVCGNEACRDYLEMIG